MTQKNIIKILIATVVLLVLINIVTVLMLWRTNFREPRRPFHKGPEMIIAEKLNFDEQQKHQLEDLLKDHFKEIRPLERQARRQRGYLMESLSGDPEQTSVDSLVQEIGNTHELIATKSYQHFQHIRALCTPEQQLAFDSLTSDLRHHLRGKWRRKHR